MTVMLRILCRRHALRHFNLLGISRAKMDGHGLSTIVRNVSYTMLSSHKLRESNSVEFEDEAHSSGSFSGDPATLIEREFDKQMLKTALDKLPDEFREVIVLRELESFSYKEIAHIMNVPIGTVMSRLARGRVSLQRQLSAMGAEIKSR